MTDVFVALDLEMTGTDLVSDEIIEIGAVKFTHDGVRERFCTLVNPGRSLPRRIEALTGIKAGELKGAPPFAEVRQRLIDFVGDAAVVGQHVDWDLAFLKKHEVTAVGPVLDTSELAEVLLPGLPDYSLRSLARLLEVEFPVQHRALPDAEAAMAVFDKLCAMVVELDGLLLAELAQLTASSSWSLRTVFRAAADEALRRASVSAESLGDAAPRQVYEPLASLQANQRRTPVAAEEVAGVLAAAGEDGEAFPQFEQRPEQAAMAAAVTAALDGDHTLVVEAATGTGKSLAYLLPAAIFALRNNQRVVISTNTINLQQQIVEKDVPALRRLLAEVGPADVRAKLDGLRSTPLKGRRNYLCLQRLAQWRRVGPENDLEARFLTRVLIWLARTESGDRAELTLHAEEEPLWNRVSAQNSNCFAGPSMFVRNGTCQLLRARKRADASHLVVVNHALLLSDVASGGRAMPNYDYLVVDEAHNLEDEATNQFGFQAGAGHVDEYLNSLHATTPQGQERGLVADIHTAVRETTSAPALRVHALADGVRVAAERVRPRVPELFGHVIAFVHNHSEGGGDYDNRLLLTAAKRSQPEWEQVELAWDNLRLPLLELEEALARLSLALGDAEKAAILDYDTLVSNVAGQVQAAALLRRGIDEILEKHDSDRIAWITTNRMTGAVSFSSAPLDVGTVLADYLFRDKAGVVLTSATLTTGGEFGYVKQRLGVEDAEELALGSPFDYKRAALVLLPTDVPEPSQREYQKAVEQAVIDLCTASKGRALVLFTSHAALRSTARAVRAPLEKQGVRVLAQGLDGSPAELLDTLKRQAGTVLLGTSSFWEGVDVAGEALSLLIIAKLPFSVPTDPVFSARSALYDEPFKEYALPQAVLRFKQGFGRLIRHKSDRGAVVILDRRLRSKNYGKLFLDSLPPCSVAQAPSAQLPELVRRWLEAARP